jgi:hypothetical protein
LPGESEQALNKKGQDYNQLETLRGIPRNAAQTFATEMGGILDGFVRQLLGQPAGTNEYLLQAKPDANQEALMWKKKFQLAEKRRQEERLFFARKEQESHQKLISIRQELKMQVVTLSRDMAAWAQEVEIANFQAPTMPSVYHEHFFEKLLGFVKKLKMRINRSKQWLRLQNLKASKAKGLWALAKKNNTFDQEILFSGERAVSMGG